MLSGMQEWCILQWSLPQWYTVHVMCASAHTFSLWQPSHDRLKDDAIEANV